MEVGHREQFGTAGRNPGRCRAALALRAMGIAATVVHTPLEAALRTPVEPAAHGRRATTGYRFQRFALDASQRMRRLIRRAVPAHHVGQRARCRTLRRRDHQGGAVHRHHPNRSSPLGKRSRSNALVRWPRCRPVTCRYLAVVLKLLWPIKRWITGSGTPASIKCVAKL